MNTNTEKPRGNRYLGLGDMKTITTRLPVTHIDLARRIAKHEGGSMAKVIRGGIEREAKAKGVE